MGSLPAKLSEVRCCVSAKEADETEDVVVGQGQKLSEEDCVSLFNGSNSDIVDIRYIEGNVSSDNLPSTPTGKLPPTPSSQMPLGLSLRARGSLSSIGSFGANVVRWESLKASSTNMKSAKFAMKCMKVTDFWALESMQPYEAVFDQLFTPPDDMLTHFFSHEWLGFSHPDPDGIQLYHMQTVLHKWAKGKAKSFFTEEEWKGFLDGASPTRAHEGVSEAEQNILKRRVIREPSQLAHHVKKGCIWLDYHSIPQDKNANEVDFNNAIKSIPIYVERADYFWVCTPTARHADLNEIRDFTSWRLRGWCRLEEWINLLSTTHKMPLVIINDSDLTTYGFFDMLMRQWGSPQLSVGNGNFTCCHFNHQRRLPDGTVVSIPCDKDAVLKALDSVFMSLYEEAFGSNDAYKRKLLQGIAPSLFAGFKSELAKKYLRDHDDPETLMEALQRLEYSQIDEVDALGWTPLIWLFDDGGESFECVREMMRNRPDLAFVRPKHNQSTLIYAATLKPELFVEYLNLDHRLKSLEEVNHSSVAGQVAIHHAAAFGFHENLLTLLQLRADPHKSWKRNGRTALHMAATTGCPACCAALLEFRAEVNCRDANRQTPLHLAVQAVSVLGNPDNGARTEVVANLLKARADPKAADAQGRTPIKIAQYNFDATRRAPNGSKSLAHIRDEKLDLLLAWKVATGRCTR